MKKDIYISDMYWKNIYLYILFEGEETESYHFYISNRKGKQYPIQVKDQKCVLNVVNFPDVKLLENDKWYIMAEAEGQFRFVKIRPSCGYKLEQMDKVFRYGKEIYGYVLTFAVKDPSEILTSMEQQNKGKLLNIAEEAEGQMVCAIHTTYMMKNRKNARRNILIETGSLKELLKKAMFIVLKKGIDTAYHILAAFRKKDGKHILLLSETRTPIGGNLKALDDRMKERGLDQTYKISYSFSKTLQQSKWKTLLFWSRLLWMIPKQDFIFVDDYVPIFKTIHLKEDTTLVQLWHAGVGFKSVGYSRFGKTGSPLPLDSCHRQYDYAIVGGKGLIHVYEEVFGIDPSQILPLGLARLDGYFDPEKMESYRKQFYEKYPQLKEKKIILFAPTYRGKGQADAYYPQEWIPQKQVYDMCGDEYVFAYKMHPFITEKIEIEPQYRERIIDLTSEGDINSLFYVTEILITDFSSNIYEFSLQEKPIIFYAPDKDYYQLTRGVHRTLDEAPGVVCTTFEAVEDTIRKKAFELEKIHDFVQESFDQQKKWSSDSLIDDIILKKVHSTSK